jgi:hypothetical protein
MTSRRDPLNRIERLLGLPSLAVRNVERRRNGDFAVMLSHRRGGAGMPRWTWRRRALRIPARRVEGYRPATPDVRPRDVRARRRQNARRFAWWLLGRLDFDTPVVERALFAGDVEAIDELREAIRAACPDPEIVLVYLTGNNRGDGERAA